MEEGQENAGATKRVMAAGREANIACDAGCGFDAVGQSAMGPAAVPIVRT